MASATATQNAWLREQPLQDSVLLHSSTDSIETFAWACGGGLAASVDIDASSHMDRAGDEAGHFFGTMSP